MIEVKGRNARPSSGPTKVLKARSTNGVKIHMNRKAKRGALTKSRANRHARHGMVFLQFAVSILAAGVARRQLPSKVERLSRTRCSVLHDALRTRYGVHLSAEARRVVLLCAEATVAFRSWILAEVWPIGVSSG
jgi:hypothetical protein